MSTDQMVARNDVAARLLSAYCSRTPDVGPLPMKKAKATIVEALKRGPLDDGEIDLLLAPMLARHQAIEADTRRYLAQQQAIFRARAAKPSLESPDVPSMASVLGHQARLADELFGGDA
jgi:hypothetical protein